MASIVLTLPNEKTIVVVVPNGDQIVPVTIHQCACGCKQWFNPVESHQVYFDPTHQQNANNNKRRKTSRKRTKV